MRVVIAAAGTGGHINPGIAIANKIKEKEPDSEIFFIGRPYGLEIDLVKRAGYKIYGIEAYGFYKEFTIQNFIKMYKTIVSSTSIAKKILKELKPDIVIGTGGYISVPVGRAALSLKIPLVFHESNAFPGLGITLFNKKATKILTGFKDTIDNFKYKNNVEFVGNPINLKKLNLTGSDKERILSEIGLKSDKITVLATGGSQGAKNINDSIFDIVKEDFFLQNNMQLIWATGKDNFEEYRERFLKLGINMQKIKNVAVLPYIYNMEEIINISDLMIARSGAMTLSEACEIGMPCIFIPLPSMSRNRQIDNARVLEKVGAAEIILDNDVCAELLENEILEITSQKENLEKMKKAALTKKQGDVLSKIYSDLKNIVDKKKN